MLHADDDLFRNTCHAEQPPRFCPHCKAFDAVGRGDSKACETCGETLVPQGYCPVCESYWFLPVGIHCPKHDLVLEAGPKSAAFHDPLESPEDWAKAATFPDSLQAEAPRIRLEAEGIPAFIDGSRMGSNNMYPVATGGARLMVPKSLVADARVILSQTWSATAAELGIDDFDHDDDFNRDDDLGDEEDPPAGGRLGIGSGLGIFLAFGIPTIMLSLVLMAAAASRWF